MSGFSLVKWVMVSHNGTNFPGTLEEITDGEYRVSQNMLVILLC